MCLRRQDREREEIAKEAEVFFKLKYTELEGSVIDVCKLNECHENSE